MARNSSSPRTSSSSTVGRFLLRCLSDAVSRCAAFNSTPSLSGLTMALIALWGGVDSLDARARHQRAIAVPLNRTHRRFGEFGMEIRRVEPMHADLDDAAFAVSQVTCGRIGDVAQLLDGPRVPAPRSPATRRRRREACTTRCSAIPPAAFATSFSVAMRHRPIHHRERSSISPVVGWNHHPRCAAALLMPPWPVLSAAVLEVTRTGMSCMMPVGHCSARMLSGVAGRSVTTMSENGALKTRR